MRALNANGQALQARRLAGESIPVVPLLFIDFASPQRWALHGVDLVWSAQTWSHREVLLSNIQSEQGDLSQIQITLPGVSDAERALAFEDCEGVEVLIYRAWVDPDGATLGAASAGGVADALLYWSGELDIPGWSTGQSSMAHFIAESRASIAMRPSVSRYTNDEQQRLFPGDTSLDFDPATDRGPLVWPAASYFRV